MMNQKDMDAANLKQGDFIDIYNHHDNVERVAPKFMVIPFSIPSQCIATYFPEANVLVPINQFAKRSHTPASKQVLVTIKKHEEDIA